jgi:hypothetical protein
MSDGLYEPRLALGLWALSCCLIWIWRRLER